MNLPFIVDVAIGLVLIYLILSVLASEIQEIFSTILQWRAAHLKKSIEILLMGDSSINLGKYAQADYATPEGVAKVIVDVFIDKFHLEKSVQARRNEVERQLAAKLKAKISPENEFTREEAAEEIANRLLLRPEVAAVRRGGTLKSEIFAAITNTPDRQQIAQAILDLPGLNQLNPNIKNGITTTVNEQVQKITPTKEEEILQTLNEINSSLQIVNVNPAVQRDVEQTIAAILLTAQTKKVVNTIYNDPLIQNVSQSSKEGIEAVLRKVTRKITTAGRKNITLEQGNEPSYIPSETFATTLLETLHIPQFSRRLTALNLRILTRDEIFSKVEELIDRYQFDSNNQELGQQLEADLEDFKQKVDLLITAFNDEKLSLTLGVNLLRSELTEYVNRVEAQLSSTRNAAGAEAGDDADTHFIKQLKALQQSIFYEDEKLNYSNTDEIIRQLQPSLGQIMDVFVATAEETKKKYATLQADPKILAAYRDIKASATGILRQMPPPVRQSLNALARRAEMNLDRTAVRVQSVQEELKQFKTEIQDWFDRSMDRASGVYKRNAKGVAFLIGLTLALIGNVDTLNITSQLSTDSTLRQILVRQADRIVTECPLPTPSTPSPTVSPAPAAPAPVTPVVPPGAWLHLEQPAFAQTEAPIAPAPIAPAPITPASPPANPGTTSTTPSTREDAFDPNDCIRNTISDQTALPIGWSQENLDKQWGAAEPGVGTTNPLLNAWNTSVSWGQRLLGWVISGIAISMGASFWFDLLGKLVNVRNTGKRPTGKAN